MDILYAVSRLFLSFCGCVLPLVSSDRTTDRQILFGCGHELIIHIHRTAEHRSGICSDNTANDRSVTLQRDGRLLDLIRLVHTA